MSDMFSKCRCCGKELVENSYDPVMCNECLDELKFNDLRLKK